MRKRFVNLIVVFMMVASTLLLNGCGVAMSGAVKDDTTLSGASAELAKKTEDTQDYRGPKLRVGIVSFENKTPSKTFGIGEAASDILGTILQKTGRFIIVSQQDMKHVLEHQAKGATGAINPATAAKMGQVLGLNAIISGAITAYSEAEEAKDFVVYKQKTQIARATVDYRVVDTTTGVQLLADSGAGIYDKTTKETLGMGSKSSYDTTLRDGALRDALTKATLNIMKQLEKRKWSGRIASVKGRQIYVNAGQKSGINADQKLLVYRAGDDIIDPVTNMKIGAEETFIGEIKILQNDLGDGGDMSSATPLGGSVFKTGDIVKLSDK
jgi:curli biogenesis system outer membrane secretion channel CsgG